MGDLGKVLGTVLLVVAVVVAFACLGAAIVKGAWWLTGMGAWTGLGPIPWGPSFFISLLFASVRSSG